MEITRQKIIYIGRRILSKGALGHKYLTINSDEPLLFKKKLHNMEQIGCILEVGISKDSVHKPYIYKGKTDKYYKDTYTFYKNNVDKWTTEDKMAYDEFQMRKEIKKKLPTYYDHAIENMRYLYRQCSPAQKQLFINRIIRDIVK